jgi:hypothetical protein
MESPRFDLVERSTPARIDDRIEDAAGDEHVGVADAVFGDDAPAPDREICGRD